MTEPVQDAGRIASGQMSIRPPQKDAAQVVDATSAVRDATTPIDAAVNVPDASMPASACRAVSYSGNAECTWSGNSITTPLSFEGMARRIA